MTAPTDVGDIPAPPVSPSGSMAHNDITTSPPHRRDPAPSLSLDALSPLLRSFSPPPSFSRTSSYRYLSPPISIASVGSPPPRPEADDYLAAGGKGKHHARREYRIHSPLIRSEGSQDSVAPSATTAPPARLVEASKIELAVTANSNDDGANLAPPLACSITVPPKERRRSWQLRDSLECLPPDCKAALLPAPSELPGDAASPALNALRRLSRTSTRPRDTSFGDIGRFSRALTGTLSKVFTFKDAPPGVSMVNENAEFLAATGARSTDLEYGAEHRDHMEDGLSEVQATPAIIILRKASAAYQPRSSTAPNTTSSSSEPSRSSESPSHPHTSIARLSAFDSKRLEKQSPSISSTVSSLKENDQASPQLDTPVQRPSLMSDDSPPRKKTRTLTLLRSTAVNRRQSVTVEAALTTAEFFPCPGILISPCSKPNFLSPEQESVRTSVVQFASRNSIHKIIWRADESSSSAGSSSPVSPTNKDTTSSKDRYSIEKPCEYINQDPLVTLNIEIQTALDDTTLSPMQNSVPGPLAHGKPKQAFFAWSWESSTPPAMESHVSLHSAHPRKSSFQVRKASTYDGAMVESFLRLSDRRSTSDRGKKPLIDLHGPFTGGEEPQSHAGSNHEEG